jgi:hypothetical protein
VGIFVGDGFILGGQAVATPTEHHGPVFCPLSAFVVVPLAIFAKPVSSGAKTPFIQRNVPTSGARPIVVIDAILLRLLHFVHRIKRGSWGHWVILLFADISNGFSAQWEKQGSYTESDHERRERGVGVRIL